MIADHAAYLQEFREHSQTLSKELPEIFSGFSKMHLAHLKDGAISAKTKELMAIAISVATHCEGCIAYHIAGALRLGASRAEIVESVGVAIVMGGGPAVIYGAEALRALDHLPSASS